MSKEKISDKMLWKKTYILTKSQKEKPKTLISKYIETNSFTQILKLLYFTYYNIVLLNIWTRNISMVSQNEILQNAPTI